ncbi:hypothetical protein MRY87_04265 [bacterium]|nr:hypothetical protein [bacterium]
MRGNNYKDGNRRRDDGDGEGRSGGRGRGGSGRRSGGGSGSGRRGGRNNNNRGRNRNGNGNGRGGNGGRGRGRGRGPRNSGTAESGNKRERIQVESGALVLIDQFMLANPQVLEKLSDLLDEEPEAKDALVEEYGGAVVSVKPDTYRIERDPYASTIVIHPDGEKTEARALKDELEEPTGRVFIDTRCLAMIDRELLDDISLLEKYQDLWVNGKDKACRDLLRDNGGAVRYGFQRFGDELSVHADEALNVVALWPDVIEEAVDDPNEAAAEAAAAQG